MRYLVILLVLITIACERNDIEKSELDKHKEMSPFLISSKEYKGTHYIDYGWVHFEYSYKNVPLKNQNILGVIDSIANRNKWSILAMNPSNRIYIKMIHSYPADTTMDTLYVDKKSSSKKLKFRWH